MKRLPTAKSKATSESQRETRAILSDRAFTREIRRGLRELQKSARVYTLDQLIPKR
jgi:hypothetical protein